MKLCIAYRHLTAQGNESHSRIRNRNKSSVILVPCGRRTVKKSRFCQQHDNAYQELLIGILEDSRNIGYREK